MLKQPYVAIALFIVATGALVPSGDAPAISHPRLLFDTAELAALKKRVSQPPLAPVAARLMARATTLLTADPIRVSTTGRGEPDPPGHLKGLSGARRLQGRVVSLAMAFLLSGDARFRDRALLELNDAIENWPIWVDTAHAPPYDLMTGEMALTFGLAWDWLYDALSADERQPLREGVERRALRPYLEAVGREKPPFWLTAAHNWNPVCNGGAAGLSLALGEESPVAGQALAIAAPSMAPYWNHLGPDGAWDEGTGYWEYGHRYAFMAADALRRAGRSEGRAYLDRPGARATGYFPLVFNPGRTLSASFGDSPHRVADPVLYFLAREYRNPDFAWFQDRTEPMPVTGEGWPEEALTLLWRPTGEDWLPEATPAFRPRIPPVAVFPSIGWAMLAPEQPDPRFFLAFKNGSLAANHTHLDLNHVSVGAGDTMLLVDLGSRSYPADYFSAPARYGYYEITTAGHNTVLVGGDGQVPGRAGELRGPIEGAGFTALVGVADNAYRAVTRVRRHVVFVDRRYFVLLDEVSAASPVPIELRFHTRGSVVARPGRGWTIAQNGVALDLVPADPRAVSGSVETPTGWIEEVRVLRLASTSATGRLNLATAIVPRPGAAGRPGAAPLAVSQQRRPGELRVSVGGDRIIFREGPDGLAVASVSIAGRRVGSEPGTSRPPAAPPAASSARRSPASVVSAAEVR
jgi:Heparinase II/III-like protein